MRRAVPIANRRVAALAAAALLAFSGVGCSSIPRGRYGVGSVAIDGMDRLDRRALSACLATREHPRLSFNLGLSPEPECGKPPFDSDSVQVRLFRWPPWTDWPTFDETVFSRDLSRIERWFRARGHYDARVVSSRITPAAAGESDTCPAEDGDDCEVDIELRVVEGEPLLTRSIEITGTDALPTSLLVALHDAVELEVAAAFDEALYDRSKRALEQAMAEASYARAKITGRVELEPRAHTARVHFDVESGPECVVGEVTVEGQGELPIDPIVGAADLRRGARFQASAIMDAQANVYALGAFSSVEVVPIVPEQPGARVLDVVIRVVPGRMFTYGVGLGVQAGSLDYGPGDSTEPQWDFHGIGRVEFRNFLGGLRHLTIEERPRFVFDAPFPQFSSPCFDEGLGIECLGNDLRLTFRQPGTLERRTWLLLGARSDLGPNPFGPVNYFRHNLEANAGFERYFLRGRLYGQVGLRGNLFLVDAESAGDAAVNVPSDYHVLFLEQNAFLDLRNDPLSPRRGAYFGVGVHEAGFFLPASWDYLRITPDVRGYVPLPLGLVLASRVAMGALFISDADSTLDITSQILGPERYRLRGGGASSDRGYVAGDLGDSQLGGLRKWDASLELRIPITLNLRTALFLDAGDVYAGTRIRLDYLHLSAGIGIRYQTLVGPLRLDVGFQVPGAQVLDGPDPRVRKELDLGFVKFPGALHLTIGESF